MKPLSFSLLMFLLCGQVSSLSASYTIDIHLSSGPNQSASGTGYDTYASNALHAMQNGLTTYGGDPSVTPTGYYEFNDGDTIHVGHMIATSVNSWMGEANPIGAFAGQHGNRLKFAMHAQTNGGAKFNLADVTWKMDSYESDGTNFRDTGGNLQFSATTAYDGSRRIGIDWGADGIRGTLDDVVYNSGEAGSTLVNELYYIGLGIAQTENTTDVNLITDQEKIDATRQFLHGSHSTGSFTIGGVTESATLHFNNPVPVPEPSGVMLSFLGLCSLLYRRQR